MGIYRLNVDPRHQEIAQKLHEKEQGAAAPAAEPTPRRKTKKPPQSVRLVKVPRPGAQPMTPASPMPAPSGDLAERLQQIRRGMRELRLLNIEYTAKDGTATSRDIEPYKLEVRPSGDVVLYGYCVQAEGIRSFRVSGVQAVRVLEYAYTPRWPVEDRLEEESKSE